MEITAKYVDIEIILPHLMHLHMRTIDCTEHNKTVIDFLHCFL